MVDFNINVVVDASGAESGKRKVQQTFTQLEAKADKLGRKVKESTRIDARSAQRGTRQIGRQFDALGTKAGALQRTLRNTFAFVGIAAGLRQILNLADSFTALQNRIRTVTTGQQQLTSVTKDLFNIAQSTRSSFEATTELYVRFTNATRELNVSQQTLLRFTESVNQAVILSGASAIEAQAGIIQLSQGLASGALQGDELRSVLEQLPGVADVIAKKMKATRGELRELGAQGKISAEIVLGAFKDAREELAVKFAGSVRTLAQAFTIATNSLTFFVGNLDSGNGVTAALAQVVVTLANNLQNMFDITTAGIATFIAYRAVLAGLGLADMVKKTLLFNKAIKAGSVVALGSAEAERQKAVAIVASTKAGLAETRQIVATTIAERALIAARLDNIKAVGAELIAQRKGVSRDLAIRTGLRADNLNRLAELGVSQVAINKQIESSEKKLIAASAGVAAATTIRTKAAGDVAAATLKANSATAKQATVMGKLSSVLPGVAAGLTAIGAAVVANPIGIAVVAIVGSLALLINFADRLDVTVGGSLVSLQDVGVATFTVLSKKITEFTGAVGKAITDLAKNLGLEDVLKDFNEFIDLLSIGLSDITFGDVILGIANTIDQVFNASIGLAVTLVESLLMVFTRFPEVIAEFVIGSLNTGIKGIEDFVNTAIDGLNLLRAKAGFDPIQLVSFGEIANPFEGAGKSLSDDLISNIKANFDRQGLTDIVDEIIKETEFNRINDELSSELLELLGDSVNAEKAVLKLSGGIRILVGTMAEEAKLLGLTSREREIADALLKQELKTKGGLNAVDKTLLGNMLEFIRARKEEADVLDRIVGPNEELQVSLNALNRLYANGRIDIEVYNSELVKFADNVTGASDGLPELVATIEKLNVLFPEGSAGIGLYGDAVEDLLGSLFGITTPMDAFETQVAQLNLLLDTGTITAEQYTSTLSSLHREFLDIPDAARDAADAINVLREAKENDSLSLSEYNDKLRELNVLQATLSLESGEGGFAESMLLAFDEIIQGAENVHVALTDAFAGAGDALKSGFSDAAAEAIIQGKDFQEVWGSAVQTIAQQLLSAIIEVGIQQAINAAASSILNTKEVTEEAAKTTAKLGGIAAVTSATVAGQAITTTSSVTASSVATGAIVADNIAITASAAPAAASVNAATFGASAIAGLAALTAIIAFSSNAFADGGFVGGTGGPRADDKLIRVSSGEFVVNADSTRKFRPLLEGLNEDRGKGFANGGIVGDNNQQAASSPQAQTSTKEPIINLITVLDPKMVDDYMQTPAGDKTFVNLVERNKGAMNSLLSS